MRRVPGSALADLTVFARVDYHADFCSSSSQSLSVLSPPPFPSCRASLLPAPCTQNTQHSPPSSSSEPSPSSSSSPFLLYLPHILRFRLHQPPPTPPLLTDAPSSSSPGGPVSCASSDLSFSSSTFHISLQEQPTLFWVSLMPRNTALLKRDRRPLVHHSHHGHHPSLIFLRSVARPPLSPPFITSDTSESLD